MEGLPVTLVLKGRRCLVVGGGPVAARKVELLLRAGAEVCVVSPRLDESLRRLAMAGHIRHRTGSFAPHDLSRAAVVVAAAGDQAVNAAAAAAARRRGIPVNVVDDPALCTFTMPAIVERGQVSIAISTGGASPTLARRLRAAIDRALPASIAALAAFAAMERRRVRAALPNAAARRRFWDCVLDGPIGASVASGRWREAAAMLRAELARTAAASLTGQVYLVGAGPGDPELLTLKAARVLEKADVIVHDGCIGESILALARRDAERVFVGTPPGVGGILPAEVNALLARLARAGKTVVRLRCGDPRIFGHGRAERRAMLAAGLRCEVVPGIAMEQDSAAASRHSPLQHLDRSRHSAPAGRATRKTA